MDTHGREQFAAELRGLRDRSGLSLGELAKLAHVHRGYLGHIEHGQRWPSRRIVEALDSALSARRTLLDAWTTVEASRSTVVRATANPVDSGELEAVELARRVAASDLGSETLVRLEAAVDDLATAYPVTASDELLDRVRLHLGYVSRLTDARATLDERRRLLVVGGWLALLAATLHIDLEQRRPARSWLDTATSLAEQTGHDEIHAWRYETEAWQVLTGGDYRSAVELSRAAQQIAPQGSSAAVQATAQEGRALARLGETRDTYDAINRVHKLAAPLPRPDRPEHHYRYDPTKAVAYTATTLAWVGDTAAVGYAREIIARLHRNGNSGRWPRRVAAANIDLALALLTTDHLDEAVASALAAMLSGMVVPSNHWRALEVVRAIEARGLPESRELRDAYEHMRCTTE
ncbi:MAG TPA: helix-turn-helix transcriptional regulator [Pseudonocardiaceae bacterium]